MKRLALAAILWAIPSLALAQPSMWPWTQNGTTATGAPILGPAPADQAGAPYFNGGQLSILPTYSATVSVAVPSGTNPILAYICGSASKIIAIRSLQISGTAGTPATVLVSLVRTSTQPTGGTNIAASAMGSSDTNNPLPTATVGFSPTATGTVVSTFLSSFENFPSSGTSSTPQAPATFSPAGGVSVFLLRNANQCQQVNITGSFAEGATVAFSVLWTEQNRYP